MNDPVSYHHHGKPVHERSYCAFLDVLGFSDAIVQTTKNKTHDKLLERFHQIFREQLEWFRGQRDDGLLFFKTFSDNVLLAFPAGSWDMETEFGIVVEALARYQLAMARSGFFVRGGLALRPLFLDEDQVFGQALLDAYTMESKVAVNPIVVLSDEAMKNVESHLAFYGRASDAPHNRVILRGPDGRYFVNYLHECIVDTGRGYKLDGDALHDHRNAIEKALRRFRTLPAVFAKYAYLAAYHNHFCDTVSHYSDFDNAFRVATAMAEVRGLGLRNNGAVRHGRSKPR